MFNPDQLESDLKHGKQYRPLNQKDKEWAFNFAKSSSFDDYERGYPMRFLPSHPQHNPQGYRIISYHRVETLEGEKPQGVLGFESVSEDKRSPYLDTLLTRISDLAESNPDFKASLSEPLMKAIDMLYPWRRYVFPAIFWAQPYDSGKKDNRGKPVMRYRPHPGCKPVGILWEINAPPGSAPKLITRIKTLAEKYPDLNDVNRGRNFTFAKKGNSYALDPEPEREKFPSDSKNLYGDDYPKLASMYAKNVRTHSEIVSLVRSAWFTPHLEKLGVDFSDTTEVKEPALALGDPPF